jgi:hypothetical protein
MTFTLSKVSKPPTFLHQYANMAVASRFESQDLPVNSKLEKVEKSPALLTWRGQDLFADFVAQVTQQVLRTQAASFRLVPGPVQQLPEHGKGHALRGERQRGATGGSWRRS